MKESILKLSLRKQEATVLSYLALNARYSVSAISRMAGLPRHVVNYTLQHLEERSLIKGYRTQINFRALGYSSYHVFLEFASLEDQNKVIGRAVGHLFVNAVYTSIGSYGVEISILAKHPGQFKKHYEEIVQDCFPSEEALLITVQSIKESVLPMIDLPASTLRKKDASFSSSFHGKHSSYSPEAMDMAILEVLSSHARITVDEIAAKLNLAKDTVKKHIHTLIRSGIIRQFVPFIDYSKLGFTLNTFLIRTPQSSHPLHQSFEALLRENPHVLWAAKSIGPYQYIVYTLSQSTKEVNALIMQLKENYGNFIRGYVLLQLNEEIKYSYNIGTK